MTDIINTEYNELIAQRRSPGDNWTLVDDPKKIVYTSLTEVLQAYFEKTGFKGEYRLAPLDSRLYVIKIRTEEIKPEEPKIYSIYGDFKQGA